MELRRMRPAVLTVTVGAALALGLGACGGASNTLAQQETATPAATSASPAAPPGVRTATLRRSSTTPVYDAKLDYPQLTGPGDAAVQTTVNATLQQAATRVVDAFAEEVKQASVDWTPPPGTATAGLAGSFDTVLLTPRLVSFRLRYSPYMAGAAHPTNVVETFTFDLRSGHRYELAELFRPGTDYLGVLSRESRRLLVTQLGDMAVQRDIDAGTRPTAEDFAGWAVSADGLQLTFGDYQVGPHAIGTPTVTIPTAALRALAAPDGPLLVR